MNFTLRHTFSLFSTLSLFFIGVISLHAQTPVAITIDISQKAQTMQNFGASGCWFSDPVGLYWPDSVKNKMAELLFSKAADKAGNLKGIGLSSWRFNIGAGTTEQGDSSGIKSVNRRVECFLNAGGTYNWNKEQGYLWFIKKARDYKVENLIAFVNSPPVFFTKNGLGFKTTNDGRANLRDDKYRAYAGFLADVLSHFDRENIHFNFISPVNEPQWNWYNKFGEGSQEGSPYTNAEIYRVTKTLDSALTAKQLSTQILITEAGMLNYLFTTPNNSETGSQVQRFWDVGSPLYLGGLSHLSKYVAGHGYFTEGTFENTIAIRRRLADTAQKYGVEYWQSEYSMLGDGFREGAKDKISAFNCALFLAKLIHYDLVYGNASAWQFWNSWEPGSPDFDTRYYLLALSPSADFKSGTFKATKNLWALGHYSRFIRPGMVRIKITEPKDNDILLSAFYGDKNLVIVVINNGTVPKNIRLNLPAGKFKKSFKAYITTAAQNDNMKPCQPFNINAPFFLLPKSIYTLIVKEVSQ